jgi:hypothetical protein
MGLDVFINKDTNSDIKFINYGLHYQFQKYMLPTLF